MFEPLDLNVSPGPLSILIGKVGRHHVTRAELAKFEAVKPALDAATMLASPPQRLVAYAEALWSVRDALANEDREMVAQIAHYAAGYSLFGMGQDERGYRMFVALCRDAEGHPASETDPAAR